jgi:TatD DNase family protein
VTNLHFVDAHCHYFKKLPPKNIELLNTGLNLWSSKKLIFMKNHTKDQRLHIALGIHPSENLQDFQKIKRLIKGNAAKISAIGEIGLDWKVAKKKTQRKKQIETFHKFLSLAEEISKPVIIHSRFSIQRVMEILKNYHLKVLLHRFDYPEVFEEVKKRKYFISLSWKTKNTFLFDYENAIPETDAPYSDWRGLFRIWKKFKSPVQKFHEFIGENY